MIAEERSPNNTTLNDYFGPEELNPELFVYIVEHDDGMVSIKHPLVFSIMHTPALNRIVNRQLAAKREMVDTYIATNNWSGYIAAHERPYRLGALMDAADYVTDVEWWQHVGFVWSDSENIREFPDEWEEVLRAERPCRHAMMEDFEREEFDMLPDLIAVYQGCTDERDDGWSWTTDPGKALWFAKRFALLEDAEPVVRKGVVDKADITAFLTRRNESEVIVDPELVRDVKRACPRCGAVCDPEWFCSEGFCPTCCIETDEAVAE